MQSKALLSCLLVGTSLSALTVVHAQKPILVKDINTIVTIGSSNPGDKVGFLIKDKSIVKIGVVAYFKATTPATGIELYKSVAGATATLVKDIYPGPVGSVPTYLFPFGNKLYFRADDGIHGKELWVSDGSAAGTKLVKDIIPGPSSSFAAEFVASPVAGNIVFLACLSGNDCELWTSDGTAAGTKLVKDINPGVKPGTPRNFTLDSQGKLLYFSARNGISVNGYEPWVSDGTTAGTRMLKDINPGFRSSRPERFVALGNKMIFQADDGTNGEELWVSDGSSAGTKLLKDILPGSGRGAFLRERAILAGKLYFPGRNTNTDWELWVTDGTNAGTKLFKDIWPGQNGSTPQFLLTVGNKIYFNARTDWFDSELFVTDGTATGTKRVADILPGKQGSNPVSLARLGTSSVVFTANDGRSGLELYISDGTSAGTKLVRDIWPGAQSSRPKWMFEILPGRVIFSADDGKNGRELWRTDGTAAGTQLVADINTVKGTLSSSVGHITEMGRKLYFHANDGVRGSELWTSDGTANGTKLLKDINSGIGSSTPQWFCELGNRIYFQASTAAAGAELWVSDGTAAGTRLLKDLWPGASSGQPRYMTRVGNKIYFSATKGSTIDHELWMTDGTAAGTKLFKDINPGSSGSFPSSFAPLGNSSSFVFAARLELWVSDGSPAGTKMLKSTAATIKTPKHLTAWNNKVYFSTARIFGSRGKQFWETDGTNAGTKLIAVPGMTGATYFTPHRKKMFFRANHSASGDELWETDGSATGTKLLKDILPGFSGRNAFSSWPAFLTSVGSRHFYFQADDFVHGGELWVSDGTAAGTKMVADVFKGIDLFGRGNAGLPAVRSIGYQFRYASLDSKIFFAANEGKNGVELWMYDNGATAKAIGMGCGTPTPTMVGTDPILGNTMTLQGEKAPNNSLALTILGVPLSSPRSLFGCPSHVDLLNSWFVLSSFVVTTPAWSFSVRIPNIQALNAITLASQTWFVGPGFPAGTKATNAVRLTFGK